ncbi:methylated-DNA--[protein]-cysteine S-methyltransferase [Rubellicoccus peritrichatus]|uniref:methylated-DNA--[protein]-cysteine S-methyltransferase n=1 Tax=Rubellicoccus peritrichatus TaxID=3080537 RepID=A0AAQ3QW46_9BACT|nr:methylated-DNA--[protein]-cysteine S-methyltransferase [Puniceicoccus sp. CR14]WOO42273.1 methylated-DNA--[protein]-cysteine S-methyltransferase [Puniceicoccus sp. CR14]
MSVSPPPFSSKSIAVSVFDPDASDTRVIHTGVVETPIGKAFVGVLDSRICFLGFTEGFTLATLKAELCRNWPGFKLVRGFEETPDFEDGAELIVRGTPLQVAVWRELTKVPPGETVTYQKIAESVGSPSAVRAVGTAVGANPVSWLIPCHRVIRKSGALGGYRWGLVCKERLLESEGVDLSTLPSD